jgi:hypothetical protein
MATTTYCPRSGKRTNGPCGCTKDQKAAYLYAVMHINASKEKPRGEENRDSDEREVPSRTRSLREGKLFIVR